LSTDIALVLSPQAVNSCLGGLGKARKGLIAQAQKSIKGSKSSGSNGKRNSAKQSTVNSDVDPNEVQFEQNVDLLKRNLRGGIEDDGMSKTDLRRLVIDLQARLEDAESKSGPRTAKLANMKRAFDPVHVEDMNETRNVAQQPQIVPKENPMKQMFKLSDLKKADGDAPKQQSNQRTEAGGRLKGKLINKSVEKEVKSLSLATAASASSSSSTDVSDHLAPAQESSALLETSSDTEMQNLKLKRPHDKNEHEEI
jgi:hypothetical protein